MLVSKSSIYPFLSPNWFGGWQERYHPELWAGHDRKCHWSTGSKISIPERQNSMFRIP